MEAVGLNVATSASGAALLRTPRRISVIGYADPTGAASLNEALSLQRAENVAAALARAGVSPDLIDVQARGARGAAADGRRVEIAFESDCRHGGKGAFSAHDGERPRGAKQPSDAGAAAGSATASVRR